MRHHKECKCEKCDDGEPRPYPVSRHPIYENPHVMMPNVNHQPGDHKGPVVTSIQEAFNSAAPSIAFQQLLQQQPDLINEKGFNGQLPIHKAALRGDPTLIELLIQHGANVNARTDFQETPIHFACKRGNPRGVHQLIEAGADVEAVDKSGKGTAHHAAQGGSVLCLQYLSEVCGQDFNRRDFFFILPLHLATLHGHKQALEYLTRKGRGDIWARDGQENTVLHLAVQASNDTLCWWLLETAGVSLLHASNNLGFTPVEVAKLGKKPQQRELASWLSHYSRQRPDPALPGGGPVHGPVMAWWTHLFLAPLFFPLLLAFSQLFPQKGWAMGAGLVAMAYTMYGHGHRMNHVCRWPNPIHAGTFAAGLFHTILCGVVEILPYVYYSCPKLIVLMMLQTMLMLYMYYGLLRGNAGVIRKSEMKEGLNEEYSVRDIAIGLIRNESLCPDCEIIPPPRSHHCKLCNLCYHDLDHHCLFLYNCIARNNHRAFLIFIFLVQLLMVEFILMGLLYIMKLHPGSIGFLDSAWFVFVNCPWVGSLLLMNVGSLGWGATLFRYQLDVVMHGHTTAYRPAANRNNLSWQQKLQNLVNFLKGKQIYIVGAQPTLS